MNSDALDQIGELARPAVARRKVLLGGLALVGTSVLGSAYGQQRFPGVLEKTGGTKPTYLPEAESKDPVVHSLAENLFWIEQDMEHAAFFIMLMPGPELADERAEAEAFRTSFGRQLVQAQAGLTKDNYRAFNQASIDGTRRFSAFKRRLQAEQVSGRLNSLVWPTFFEHTAREGDYFINRLERLSAGDVSLDRGKAAEFWTLIMGEHAGFIAHLLDPAERELVATAMQTSDAFHELHRQNPAPADKTTKAVDNILDFKVAAAKGINAGEIKSIIDPRLADHVRREALKAADDLRRSA
jgi:hypothetical protein